MGNRIPPGYAELAIQWNLATDPEPMLCFLGLKLAVGVGATQADTDAICQAAISAADTQTSDDYTLGPGWVVWGQDGGDIRIDASISPIAGLVVGTAYPPQVCVLVKKLTASGGRRGRGRLYQPGINSGVAANNGVLTTGSITAFNTQWAAVRNDLIALAQVESLVLLHDSPPFTPTVITSLEVSTRLATQRRRLRP